MTDSKFPDNVLFELYERYIGEPEDESDVYRGFGLFFAGVVFAVFGLLLFIVGAAIYGLRTDTYFALAQPGYVLGMLSLPITLLGIIVLLPTERRVELTAFAGFVVTVIAAVVFLMFYPDQWFEVNTQNTLLVVGIYALGLTGVIAATGAALVAHQLERVQPPAPSEIESAEEAVSETITEEEIQEDIESAMSDVELSWGGVETEEHRRLEFTPDYTDEDTAKLDLEATRTVSDSSVDAQVQGLNALKGGAKQTATSEETVDDQASALSDLRRQKERDEIPSDAPVSEGGIIEKISNMFKSR